MPKDTQGVTPQYIKVLKEGEKEERRVSSFHATFIPSSRKTVATSPTPTGSSTSNDTDTPPQTKSDKGSCLSSEDLTAFLLLSDEQRTKHRHMHHLMNCASCREHYHNKVQAQKLARATNGILP